MDSRQFRDMMGILMELPVIRMYDGEWQFHECAEVYADVGLNSRANSVNGLSAVMDNVSAVEFDCLFRPLARQMDR